MHRERTKADAPSIVEKMKKSDANFEYFAEPIMHELMGAKDFGKYTDKTTGKMQLCFLTNNDILYKYFLYEKPFLSRIHFIIFAVYCAQLSQH